MMIHRDGDWLAAKGNYIGLSSVGARIWELIETPQTIESLCDRLVAEYEVDPATCRAEVNTFLTALGQHQAIRIDDN